MRSGEAGRAAVVGERSIVTAVRDAEAAQLRHQGYTYRQIGDRLGVTPQSAWDMVKRALAQAVRDAGHVLLTLELERLDAAVQPVLAMVTDPDLDPQVRLMAVDRLVKLSESRRKLLGTDAPSKSEHRILDATDAAIEQLAEELRLLENPELLHADAED